MNIRTRMLMDKEYISILCDELGYLKIKVVSIEVHRDYKFLHNIKDYIHNQNITIRYHLLADFEDIYMSVVKKGVHLNGDYDYQEITIFKEDLEVLYTNKKINTTKKRKR